MCVFIYVINEEYSHDLAVIFIRVIISMTSSSQNLSIYIYIYMYIYIYIYEHIRPHYRTHIHTFHYYYCACVYLITSHVILSVIKSPCYVLHVYNI